MSSSGISMSSVCSSTGTTSTAAKLVWRRPWLSKGLIRTSRWPGLVLCVGLGGSVGVVLLCGQLDHPPEVLEPLLQPLEPLHGVLELAEAAGHLLGVGLVVPQVRRRDLLPEFRDLLAHPVE